MSGQDNTREGTLIDRECGACNVCCVALTIDDDELQKPQGFRCRNAQRDGSCAIYETRPVTCRDFLCGWRRMRWVRQTLRPDLSGVLVRQHVVVAEDGSERKGVVFTLLHAKAVEAEGLAETMAAAVVAGVPVFLHIPGPPGYTSAQTRLNDALMGPVLAKDKAAMLDLLREARKKGLRGPKKRIVMKPRKPAAARV